MHSLEVKAAIARAADWLEANPEKHGAGILAVDARGFTVEPTDPAAKCFCALGRIAKEANLVTSPRDSNMYGLFHDFLQPLNISSVDIYIRNDRSGDFGYTDTGSIRGNPAVINYLREISK